MAGQRKSAEERREEIVGPRSALRASAATTAPSTEAIARDAGISQPYLFRLFKTKRELFLACHDVSHERILETFRARGGGRAAEERAGGDGHGLRRACSPTATGSSSRCSPTRRARTR